MTYRPAGRRMGRDIVLIGHGYWGKNIARNLSEMGRLRGVFDADSTVRGIVENRYPGCNWYSSFDEVLEDGNVVGVAISTPAATHYELAIEALRAGKDVFVEKPLALEYDQGLEIVALAKRAERILMVGHLLEYHYAVRALDHLVKSGELGTLQYLYSNRLNLGKFRQEENILWSFAPHDIAVILRLVGAAPIEVAATGGAYLQPDVADSTVTSLLFANGARAHIFVSWLHPYKEQRLVVVGSKKMAVFDDMAEPDRKLIVFDKGADWVDRTPVPRHGEGIPATLDVTEPLRDELSHFVDCIETRQEPLTDGENGLRVLEVLRAAENSQQSGGLPIAIAQK